MSDLIAYEKLTVGLTLSTSDEQLLRDAHFAGNALIRSYLQNDLGYAPHTELLPASQHLETWNEMETAFRSNGQRVVEVGLTTRDNRLFLKHTPVWQTGLVVYQDMNANAGQATGAFDSSTLLTAGTDYWLDVDNPTDGTSQSGILWSYGQWSREPRSIKVTYYGGVKASALWSRHAEIAYAARVTCMACYLKLKAMTDTANGTPLLQSETIGSYSYSTNVSADEMIRAWGVSVPIEAVRALSPLQTFRGVFGGG